MISSNSLRSPGGGDDRDRFSDEEHERPNEEYDEEGNVVKVENLEFIPGVLGQGSFGTVRLARRLNLGSAGFSNIGTGTNAQHHHPEVKTTQIFRNALPSPVDARRSSRRHSFDETGVNGDADRPASSNYYGNSLIKRAQSFGLFRSKSVEYMGERCTGENNRHDDELVAVKIFSKSNLKRRRTIERDKTTNRVKVKTALQQVEREIALMKKLSHPNLVRLYEVINSPETDILYMVLEYMPLGEVLTFREEDGTFRRSERLRHRQIDGLVDDGHFDEEHVALYIVDILHALAYLHQHHICHRDLKPENILLSDKGIAKVGDFGVSHIFEEENSEDGSPRFLSSINESCSQRRLSKDVPESNGNTPMMCPRTKTNYSSSDEAEENPFFLTRHESDSAYAMGRLAGSGILTKTEGTWCFWSPEMCNGLNSGGFSGYAADMWAVGICLYIFATGKLPFYNTLPLDLFDMIAKCDLEYSGLDLSDSLVDLLKSCLEKDPKKRAGVGDCLHHPFLQNAREQRIRQLGPEFEISRDAILHISEDDIRMAFRTVTSVPAKVLRCAGKKLQEGLAHTCDNLRARIPSLAPQITSRDADCVENKESGHDDDRKCGDMHQKIAEKKQNNNVLFFGRQFSDDSCQSEPENNHYPLKLKKNENESETETETHVSRLSSGISFGSTVTDDFHPKEFTSRMSFGSNNTDELPMILSEEDDTQISMEGDVRRLARTSVDEEIESIDSQQHHESDNDDCPVKTSDKSILSDKGDDYPLPNSKAEGVFSDQSGMDLSNVGETLDQEIETRNRSGCLIQ